MKRHSRPTRWAEILPSLGRIRRHLGPYLRPHRPALAGGLVALVAATLFQLLEPWPLKVIVDNVLGGEPLPELLSPLGSGALIAVALAALVVVVALRAAANYAATIAFALVGNRVVTRLRSDLFAHLQALPLAFHVHSRVGDMTMRLMADIGMTREAAVTAALPLIGNFLILAGLVAVMLWMNWVLALIALFPLPLVWFATVSRGRKIQDVSRAQRRREGQMASAAGEALAGIRSVQALGLEARVAAVFDGANAQGLKQDLKGKRLAAGLERRVDLVIGIATAGVLGIGAHLVLAETLTLGTLLVFLTYMKTALRPVRDLAKLTARLAKASAAGERILDVLNVALPAERDDLPEMPRPKGNIAFENVIFAYGPERPVLSGFNLSIAAGTSVAVMGPSGGGKSTIANLLLALAEPDSGEITIDGQSISAFHRKSVRHAMTMVLQETWIFAGTIRDNIAITCPDADDNEIARAVCIAGLEETIAAWPKGLDTEVGEAGADLSGGQRQRIAIARAALSDAPILILDEPTTGLDQTTRRQVVDALMRMAFGRTTLLITHEPGLAARADRTVWLEDGRIVEDTAATTEFRPRRVSIAAGAP
jgi:ATP-binding cassette subfamily B protein